MSGRVTRGRLVPRPEAVRLLGVSDRGLDRLVAAGELAPTVPRSGRRPSMFDAAAVRQCAKRVAAKARAAASGQAELEAALCRRLDALSYGTAAALAQLREDNLDAGEVERVWSITTRWIRARLLRVPAEWSPPMAALLAAGASPAIYESAFADRVRALLVELGTIEVPLPPGTVAPVPVPVVAQSRTVREARTQLAHLQAQVLEVRSRIKRGRLRMAG